ncbi:MAG: glycosyltransferase family 2 protein, partial [Acidimicrobiia bacterium]|nr:glycosyltransferase family 2 protein [Acidimicrobiia bacterium]
MPTSAPGRQPSVAVIVVNFNGVDFLGPCLDSIAALDYPAELVETIVVDNGSVDGSLELLEERYPWVRVLPQSHNLGFAPAVNVAANATEAECIALVNNDMRVEPGWLGGLVSEYDPDRGVVCVGGVILSWDGSAVDFVEGFVNFSGMGDQPAFGRPVDEVDTTTPRDLLFACGSSLLASRDVFLDIGGFDDSYFAYYEDVDLGWRLWLAGYDVRMAPQSRSFHLHRGTSSRFPEHQRLTLLERNALRTIIKNYDDRHLREVLGASLLLYMKRAAIRAELDSAAYAIGGDAGPEETVPRAALASLEAAAEVIETLDDLLRRRAEVQATRKRSDAELIERFGG